jgi:DNA-binding SARP family transcriptional activator
MPSGGFGTYRLELPVGVLVDLESAWSRVEAAERHLAERSFAQAVLCAEEAVRVAERPFLPDSNGPWVAGVRRRLNELQLWALTVLSEGYAQQGAHQRAVQVAEQAIELEPFRERSYRQLMQVHASAGNPAEGLRVFDHCRKLLAAELGIAPSAETADVHRTLLRNH